MTTQRDIDLADRTRGRSRSIWVNMFVFGLDPEMLEQEDSLNRLHRATVENYLAITDEVLAVKEDQRDRTIEQSQAEIAQDRLLADKKVEAGRQKIAIHLAAEEYYQAARLYDAQVKGLIMGAKEYAAAVEQEQLATEGKRLQLAVQKEEVHRKEINAKIVLEQVQKSQVEVEIARAKVDVAKANVRAIMADIEAQRASLVVIEAEVQEAMAVADQATLKADIATIFVEILTKKLSEIKLDVGKQEIEAGFQYIQARLTALLELWGIRKVTEDVRQKTEVDVLGELSKLLAAEKGAEDLKTQEAESSQQVLDHEGEQTQAFIEESAALKEGVLAARQGVIAARGALSMGERDKRTWAEVLVNGAQIGVYKNSQTVEISTSQEHLTVGKG